MRNGWPGVLNMFCWHPSPTPWPCKPGLIFKGPVTLASMSMFSQAEADPPFSGGVENRTCGLTQVQVAASRRHSQLYSARPPARPRLDARVVQEEVLQPDCPPQQRPCRGHWRCDSFLHSISWVSVPRIGLEINHLLSFVPLCCHWSMSGLPLPP